jgi:hypothetical protein
MRTGKAQMSRINLRRGGAILLCLAALTAIGAASAGAKPKKLAFTPKIGKYEGTATVGGDHLKVGSEVTKKGPKYTVTFGLSMPTTCESAIGPQSDLFGAEIKAPVKGKAFSFKGPVENRNGEFNADTVDVKATGHFTSASAFGATGSIELPPEVHCAEPPVMLKEKLTR